MEVAHDETVCGPASSLTVWSLPSKLGLSFTALTVIVNVCSAEVSIPSLSVPPSVLHLYFERGRTIRVGRGRVRQRAVRRYLWSKSNREQAWVADAGDRVANDRLP
jgi:hypothetical protein